MFILIWIYCLLFHQIKGLIFYEIDQLNYFFLLALSFNQPKFNTNTIWFSNATTFADQNISLMLPWDIFINSKNTIYMVTSFLSPILFWTNESDIKSPKTISGNLTLPSSIFVTTNGDIYVDNARINGGVDKWIEENDTWTSVFTAQSSCSDLFVDIDDSLYCSMLNDHKIDKRWPNGTTTTIAGIGVAGSTLDMLDRPWGIFVDINFDLYVADSNNHRIQLFRLNQRNGITVAGNGSLRVTIKLKAPSSVILDGDQYLFIVDTDNNRIIGSNENGFYCLFGCSGEGSTNDKLSNPLSMSFDSYGNIYVIDSFNTRIQKIIRSTSRGKCFFLFSHIPLSSDIEETILKEELALFFVTRKYRNMVYCISGR